MSAITAFLPLSKFSASWEPLDYERLDSEGLSVGIRLREGEALLVLQPFGWHLNGKHIPNAAEQFSREGVCVGLGVEVVCEFGPYLAVVRAVR